MLEQSLVKADPFVLMDRMDDEQILTELKGAVADKLVYSYEQDGKTVEGLSKVGVDAAVKEMARSGEVLRELDCEVFRDTDAYEFIVTVGRYAVTADKEVLLDTAKGFKRQEKVKQTKRGPIPNPFFFEQGGIKAARNAKRRLISEELAQKIMLMARQQGRVQKVEADDQGSNGNAETADRKPCPKHPGQFLTKKPSKDGGHFWSHPTDKKDANGKTIWCNESTAKTQKHVDVDEPVEHGGILYGMGTEDAIDATFEAMESAVINTAFVEPQRVAVKPEVMQASGTSGPGKTQPQGLTKAQLVTKYGDLLKRALKLEIDVEAVDLNTMSPQQIVDAGKDLLYRIEAAEKVKVEAH